MVGEWVGETIHPSCHSEEARVQEKVGDSVVKRHGDGRGRLAAARDRG
jgi:hypothetical protein